MAKPEWGFKRTCLSCAAKFYDMQKDPIVCPACEAVFDPEAATKLKRGRQQIADEKAKQKAAANAEAANDESGEDDDDLDDDLGDDDGVLEDTSDLDDDDVPVVGAPSGDGDES